MLESSPDKEPETYRIDRTNFSLRLITCHKGLGTGKISNMLNLKAGRGTCQDIVSLGEILLRFDPGEDRIHTARSFKVYDGGGEYNVAKNLSQTFSLRAAIVTALADNPLGRLAENLARGGGVDTREIIWRAHDGVGANTRNGIYFIERGLGQRSPLSSFDRANTAVSQLKPGDVDWQKIFSERGARWFHTGGIFAGLSETSPQAALEAMKRARQNGSIVSYDLNYRESLWKSRGGIAAANAVNRQLLPFADVVFGIPGFAAQYDGRKNDDFKNAAAAMQADFPNLKVIATTFRSVHSASRHDLSASVFFDGNIKRSRDYPGIEIFDRVGSGDAFAAGLIYGLIADRGLDYAVECAAAAAVHTMTTPGDNCLASLDEIESIIAGNDGFVVR